MLNHLDLKVVAFLLLSSSNAFAPPHICTKTTKASSKPLKKKNYIKKKKIVKIDALT